MKAAVAVAAALVASLLPQAPAGAASICDLQPEERPPLQEPVELCGTTVITGTHSATMKVQVPQGTTVLEAAVDIATPGRYGGVAFVPDVPGRDGDAALISRLGGSVLCDESGCTPPPVHVFSYSGGEWFNENQRRGAAFLAAGTYIVHLIADSAPTEVRLRLAARPGEITLRPETPASIEIQSLPGRVPAQSAFWDGGFRVMKGPGLYIANAWAILEPAVIVAHDVCEYASQPSEPLAYAPGCPGARRHTTGDASRVGVFGGTLTRVASIAVGSVEPGPLGIGQSVTIGGRAKRIGALTVWLTFS